MIKGLGTDILKVSRFRKVLEKHSNRFIKKLLNDEEYEHSKLYKDKVIHLAGRFCAKEAVAKALGTGFGKDLSFKDITIQNNSHGKPVVSLSKKTRLLFQNPKIEISISHCKEYATATAIWF